MCVDVRRKSERHSNLGQSRLVDKCEDAKAGESGQGCFRSNQSEYGRVETMADLCAGCDDPVRIMAPFLNFSFQFSRGKDGGLLSEREMDSGAACGYWGMDVGEKVLNEDTDVVAHPM